MSDYFSDFHKKGIPGINVIEDIAVQSSINASTPKRIRKGYSKPTETEKNKIRVYFQNGNTMLFKNTVEFQKHFGLCKNYLIMSLVENGKGVKKLIEQKVVYVEVRQIRLYVFESDDAFYHWYGIDSKRFHTFEYPVDHIRMKIQGGFFGPYSTYQKRHSSVIFPDAVLKEEPLVLVFSSKEEANLFQKKHPHFFREEKGYAPPIIEIKEETQYKEYKKCIPGT